MTAPNIVLPSKPINKGAATSGSQRDRRFSDTFFDTYKHPRFPKGRPFCGEREFTSGTDRESITAGFISADLQCGEYFCDNPELGQTPQERQLSLASVWAAPWLPTGGKKYMNFNYRRKIITFDYIKGEQDEKRALENYYRAAAKLAGANGWGAVEFNVTPSYQITSVIGEPTPYLPIWQAARAGDPWLMGAVDEPNERLAKILGFGEVQYLGERFADSEYVVVPQQAAPRPPVSVDKILDTPMPDLAKMVAEAVAAALAAQEQLKRDQHSAKVKAGLAKKKDKAA